MRLPFLISIALATRVFATSLDPSFTETDWVQSFQQLGSPSGLAWAPDGSNRLFVTRKGDGRTLTNYRAGEVRIVQNGVLLPTPFCSFNAYTAGLDSMPVPSSEPVYTNGECGLLSICFDPNFINNRYVYLMITVSPTEQQIIRFTDNGSIGTNKTVILPNLPTQGTNHNGGGLGIGPDGKIYWSIGDNTNNDYTDDNFSSLAGKVGRADRFTGAIPNDNPFFDGPGINADHAWARGFRNPFSLVFHPINGKLWLNVTGSSYNGGTQPAMTVGYEQVIVVERGGHGGWNDYENTQPAGFLAPVIAYRTGGTTTVNFTVSGAQRSGGIVTFTSTGFHPFRRGAKATVAGVGDASFNGSHYVASRLSDTQFTVVQAGPDAVSGGGTATTLQVGTFNPGPPFQASGSLTGGCFYDSTAAPAAYHGNFFTGDSVSGTMIRATLDSSSQVSSVDRMTTGGGFAQIDTCVGPDGALYYISYGGGLIRRLAYNGPEQNVIVQPTGFNVVEGGSALFTVRLAQAPAVGSPVTVTISRVSGDADVNLASSAVLTFTNASWAQLQTVTIAAAEDADLSNDSAVFRISSTGLPSYDVSINGIDNDEPTLLISRASLAIAEGNSGTFTVSLASAPAANVTVNVARTGGDSDINVTSSANLVFTTGNYATPQTVTIAAVEDADTAPDAATISITRAGEATRVVNVTATDNESVAPVFTSIPVLTAVVGQPYTYDVNATGNPTPTYSFATFISGMSINTTTGLVTWTPASTGTFNAGVRASGSGMATQLFTITVNADQPPIATITSPVDGEIIFGSAAEFFGDGFDDAGTTKAEFFVDDILHSTDPNILGHYHYLGAHFFFDSTQFTNGPHTLRKRVTDTAGQTGEEQVQIFISNGAGFWRSEKFTAAEQANSSISGDLADPDHDGMKNLFEYVGDTGPKSGTSSRMPEITTVNIGGTDYLALEFVTARWASDVVVSVEVASSPAGPWTSIDPNDPLLRVSLQQDTPGAGLDTRVVRDAEPLTSGQRYMRLRATR